MARYCIVNGVISDFEEINISHLILYQTFKISRKIWFGYAGIPLLFEHLDFMKLETDELNLPFPPFFSNSRELYRIIKRMLHKNRFYRSGLIHIQIFWHDKVTNWIITAQASSEFEFPNSKNGILAGFSDILTDEENGLCKFQTQHETIWNTAELSIQNSSFHNLIFLNRKRNVCECIRSNIYMFRENQIITPSSDSGCFNDLMHRHLIDIFNETGMKVTESHIIKKDDLFQMNEVFLASEEFGIQWVMGIENKRYVRLYSELIHKKINDVLKLKSESIQ